MPAILDRAITVGARPATLRTPFRARLDALKDAIAESGNVVFFGGAGVSTESGIPDFRSRDGLYNLSYDYPPETILSHSFYLRFPDVFWRFYREKVLVPALAAKPNAAHEALARLEADGHLSAIVTQNIDGLHQKAGSNRVLELHGSIHRNYCESCHAFYPAEAVLKLLEKDEIPRCTRPGCKGHIKPDVVLYEEQLNGDILDAAIESISAAEVMLIGGTSLVVNPAAGLVGLFSGKPLAVINRDETTSDHNADLLFRENIGRVLGELYR